MDKYYRNSWMKVLESVGTNLNKGLLEYDCILRREKFNSNIIQIPLKKKIISEFKECVSIWNLILSTLLAILFFVIKEYTLGGIVFLMIIINLVYRILFILDKNKYIKNINKLNLVNVTVIREGIERIIEAHELVIGDIVKLKVGSIVSADMRIVKSNGLKVSEKSLTGKNMPIEKDENTIDDYINSISAITNMVFRGSKVIEGDGIAVVVQCGENTYLGENLKKAINKKNNGSLIGKVDSTLNKMNFIIAIISIILFMIIPGAGMVKNRVLMNTFFSIMLICIPCISIIVKIIIKNSLIKDDIKIDDISVIAHSENVNVLFVNELGSITKEEVVLRSIYCDEGYKDVKDIDKTDINLKRILDILYINSSDYSNKKAMQIDVYDKGYLEFFNSIALEKLKIKRENKFKFRIEPEYDKKFITTVVKNERGYRANVKGALDDILSRATYILVNGIEKPLTAEEKDKIKRADLLFSNRGFITEAMAYRSFNYEPSQGENVESNLVFVGLTALENLLRGDVVQDIQTLYDNGVLPIVFSNNNKIVAEVINRKAGIVRSSSEVISGAELSFLNEKEYLKCVSNSRVFCRLTNEQKNKLVTTFNQDGFKVAIEGDSLSELGMLKESLVGMVKEESSQLLKDINSNVIKDGAIKSILKLKEKGNELNTFISESVFMYILFMLGQIFTAYNYYFVDDGNLFSLSSLIIFNVVLIIPIILLNRDKANILSRNQKILIGATYIVIGMMAIPLVEKFSEFVAFSVLAINMFITVLLSCNFKISFKNINFIILLVYLLLTILSVYLVYILGGVVISKTIIFVVTLLVIIYTVMFVMTKRWQN